MSDNRVDLQEYVGALRDTIPDSIELAARAALDDWRSEMSIAADIGDEQAAARLAWMISE